MKLLCSGDLRIVTSCGVILFPLQLTGEVLVLWKENTGTMVGVRSLNSVLLTLLCVYIITVGSCTPNGASWLLLQE